MNELAKRLRLLYICSGGEDEIAHLSALLDGGVTAVQLRMKNATGRELYERALAVGRICREKNTLFFVNDRLDVALACDADGVHLGANDLPIAAARCLAPCGFLLGATARAPTAAIQAERDGADYIGCGAAFPSTTKHDTTLIGPSGIASVVQAVKIPVVAIGGITTENLNQLENTGISGVAVSAALNMDPANTRNRAKSFRETLQNWREAGSGCRANATNDARHGCRAS